MKEPKDEKEEKEAMEAPQDEATDSKVEAKEALVDVIMFDDWLEESIERMDLIHQAIHEKDLSTREVDLLYDKAIRPYHYYKEDQKGNNLTIPQFKAILQAVNNQGRRGDFVKWAKEKEGIKLAQGTHIETIADLTKEEASDFLDYIYG